MVFPPSFETLVSVEFHLREDALIFLFDNGVKEYQFLTKKLLDYKSLRNIQTYQLWHLENQVGYVIHGLENYVDKNGRSDTKKSVDMEIRRLQ